LSVFKIAEGELGYKFFGVVMWSAAITSVIGASYTSVSFWKTFHPVLEKNQRWLITVFIIFSTAVFVLINKTPSAILVIAGGLNGLILPLALSVMLIAASKKRLMNTYKHPLILQIIGWIVVVIMIYMGYITIQQSIGKL